MNNSKSPDSANTHCTRFEMNRIGYFLSAQRKKVVMKNVPEIIMDRFDSLLNDNVPEKYRPYYHKWLSDYLYFCSKL